VHTFINILEEIIQVQVRESVCSAFSIGEAPEISLIDYIERCIKYLKTERGTFIAMMVYLDKIAVEVQLTNFNIHRLLLGAFSCATKYTCDICPSNKYLAKVGGISTEEMNIIEATILEMLDYDLYISP